MFIHHIKRGRHWQVARNLTIAVATAALAGGGAAMAADGGGAPLTKKEALDQPAANGAGVPLDVISDARTRLAGLVADGTITQGEADTLLQGVSAGSVDTGALVRAGELSSAHEQAVVTVLDQVKRAHMAPGS
jgi:hypothetical protein